MTQQQIIIAKALGRCRYLPASSEKRFANNMAGLAEYNSEKELTEKQIRYMYLLACKKRNSIGQQVFNLIPKEIWSEYKKQHKTLNK